MQNWLIVSLLLSIFGFLKEIRPSEPFIYEFLIGEWRNITEEQVNQQVYPAGTYSYLGLLTIVFLITDLARYKPLIVFLGISGVIVWSMLLWTTSLAELLILEQVTSHTRAALLAGRSISGILGQVLISLEIMDYRQLNYISLGALIAATLWSLLLPSVNKSIYFHQEKTLNSSNKMNMKLAFQTMWQHFKQGYANVYTLKWSIWFSLSTCGFIQVQVYMQPLWTAIVNDPSQPIYNGAVEAALTIIGFLGALAAGVLKVNWQKRGEIILASCSLIQGAIMLICARAEYVIISYVFYVLFGALYHFVITIASSEIAKHIEADSYGLIFGINTFGALAFQAILTMVVVTSGIGFGLPARSQFVVYGLFHIVLGVIFVLFKCVSFFTHTTNKTSTQSITSH
ncbi:hypothetical protein HUJ05_000859 [Dendroctonus ponderosae]|nr:hypothetical protein HUJ05_000859 [Dendroctonus ponderosae]